MDKIETNIQPVIPAAHKELMEKAEKLTKEIVELINEKDEEYSTNAAALAFATLYYLKTASNKDEAKANDIRSAILEIISEGR